MNIAILVMIILFVFVMAVAVIMDGYKKVVRGYNTTVDGKTVRKTKAKPWEIRLIACSLSLLSAIVVFYTVDIRSVYPQVNQLIILPYAIVIYLLQLPACMTVIKWTSNEIFRSWLKRHGIRIGEMKNDGKSKC